LLPFLNAIPALISAINSNGESWKRQSNPKCPLILKPNASAYSSRSAPNWTVFDVIARYA
jgi:hypothetical protein